MKMSRELIKLLYIWSFLVFSLSKLILLFAPNLTWYYIIVTSFIYSFYPLFYLSNTQKTLIYKNNIFCYLIISGLILVNNYIYNSIVFFIDIDIYYYLRLLGLHLLGLIPVSFLFIVGRLIKRRIVKSKTWEIK